MSKQKVGKSRKSEQDAGRLAERRERERTRRTIRSIVENFLGRRFDTPIAVNFEKLAPGIDGQYAATGEEVMVNGQEHLCFRVTLDSDLPLDLAIDNLLQLAAAVYGWGKGIHICDDPWKMDYANLRLAYSEWCAPPGRAQDHDVAKAQRT